MQRFTTLLTATAALATAGAAHASLITFEEYQHGEIVSGVSGLTGVTVTAVNPNRSHDLAIIFDSRLTDTADPDLEAPWNMGNIDPDTVLGNLLIIAENDVDSDGDGFIDSPDDEGSRPAGSLSFSFDTAITEFGMDLVDVEGVNAENGSLDFYLDDALLASVSFDEFITLGSMFYDPTIEFGNNSANRIAPITAAMINADAFNGVRVNMGGSGALDNIAYRVPAPGAAVALLGGFFVRRRRRGNA